MTPTNSMSCISCFSRLRNDESIGSITEEKITEEKITEEKITEEKKAQILDEILNTHYKVYDRLAEI